MLTLVIARGAVPALPADSRELDAWTTSDGTLVAARAAGGGERRVVWPGVGTFICADGSSRVDVWPEPSAPLRTVIDTFDRAVHPALLPTRPGYQALHASAALVDDVVVGFCGRSGAGKSTLAYAFGQLGYTHFADDALAIEMAEPIAAVALPCAPRLRQPAAEHFATLQDPPAVERAERAPLRAVVLLDRTTDRASEPHLDRLPATTAFHEILTHAHCFDPRDREESKRLVEDVLRLAQAIDVYSLRFGSQLDALPSVIRAIAGEISSVEGRVPVLGHAG
jgi:hypothetical protein